MPNFGRVRKFFACVGTCRILVMAALTFVFLPGCRLSQPLGMQALGDKLEDTFRGADPHCQKPRNIDPELQLIMEEYEADARTYGQEQFPLDRLGEIRDFRLVPLGSPELRSDNGRLGLNHKVDCYDGKRIYDIYIADPSSTPEMHRLRGRNILHQVVYHELTHTHFDHYDDSPHALSTDVGIMAAITDDRWLTDVEMERRKIELFSPDSDYLAHLPHRD